MTMQEPEEDIKSSLLWYLLCVSCIGDSTANNSNWVWSMDQATVGISADTDACRRCQTTLLLPWSSESFRGVGCCDHPKGQNGRCLVGSIIPATKLRIKKYRKREALAELIVLVIVPLTRGTTIQLIKAIKILFHLVWWPNVHHT